MSRAAKTGSDDDRAAEDPARLLEDVNQSRINADLSAVKIAEFVLMKVF